MKYGNGWLEFLSLFAEHQVEQTDVRNFTWNWQGA